MIDSPPLPEPRELRAIADQLADCVDRLDAAGLAVEANHVDLGRALIARRLIGAAVEVVAGELPRPVAPEPGAAR